MKTIYAVSIAGALVVMSAATGCTSTGKYSESPLAGLVSKDKSLRAAVEKDPFPQAQGMLAARSGQ